MISNTKPYRNSAKLLLVAVLFSACGLEKTYKVEITYCDSRPKKIVYVTQIEKPDNYQIDTWKMAVPKYRGELNVCNIRVVE